MQMQTYALEVVIQLKLLLGFSNISPSKNFFKELFYRINGQKRRMEFSYFAIEPLRQWPSGEHKRSDYHGCYLVKHNGVKCIL